MGLLSIKKYLLLTFLETTITLLLAIVYLFIKNIFPRSGIIYSHPTTLFPTKKLPPSFSMTIALLKTNIQFFI